MHFVARCLDLPYVPFEIGFGGLAGRRFPIDPHVAAAPVAERHGGVVALTHHAAGEGHGLRRHGDAGRHHFAEPGGESRGRRGDVAPTQGRVSHITPVEIRRLLVRGEETTENVVRPDDLVILVNDQQGGVDVVNQD